MRSTHTFSIDIIIRRCKQNQERGIIYARITVDGDSKEISLKEQIDVKDWDSSKEEVTGRSREAKLINEQIDEARFRIKQKYKILQESESIITAESVKAAYLGVLTLAKEHTLTELLDYYKKIWELKLKNGGFKNYKTTIDYLKLFLGSQYVSGNIFISQVNMQVITEFEHYVRTTPIKEHDPCLGNGIAKHIQRFKRILNWAVEIGWLKINPCEKYSCPLKRSRRKKLTMDEVFALEEKTFHDASLNYIKDLFIFSCFTSFAYIDAITLTLDDFQFGIDGKTWCNKYRTKSEELQLVPLLKNAEVLLSKYKSQMVEDNRKTIFPYKSNQFVNRCLKIIQQACEIATPMTFHVARHTFAKTVALKHGVPMETIQMIMGHTKITTTQIYADVDEEKISDDMTGLENRLDKKREILWAANQLKAV